MKKDMQVTFITSNVGKANETKRILFDWEILLQDIDLVEIQDAPTEIIKDKARKAFNKVKGPVLVEDTSLFFNALKDLPGPFIKHFMKMGSASVYKILDGFTDKTGYALCLYAYMNNEHEPIVFSGRVDGTIVFPKGNNNFGWDNIFMPNNCDKTFAEMSLEEKLENSPRTIALQKFSKMFRR